MLFNLKPIALKAFDIYRPYIQYKWNTTIDDSGNRVLVDSGVVPKFPATMYSGRGIKFNGVDQALVTDIYPKSEWTKQTISCEVKEPLEAKYELLVGAAYSPSAQVGSLSITNFNLNDGTYNDYTINIHYEYSGIDYALTLTLSAGFKGTITGSLDFTTGEMKGYLDGKLIKSKIFNELIGKSPSVFDYPFAIGAGTTGSSAARGYFSKTLGNVIFLSDILSDTEVQYLYYNPEKFLYREDNILKSKILPQYKIDAVEFYAPMCETDGYVRDYSKYSEILIPNIATDTLGDTSDEVMTINSATPELVDCEITTAGTYVYRPNFQWKSSSNMLTGTVVRVKATITNVSGEVSLYKIGVGNAAGIPNYTNIDITDRLEIDAVYTMVGEGALNPIIYINGTKVGHFTITNVSVQVLRGTNNITNYTSDQNVKQLSTGLQTCFWERDILGVPEILVTKGIIGDKLTNTSNVDTPYVLPFDKDFTLEMVYYNPYSSNSKYMIFGSDYTQGVLIGKHPGNGLLYLRLFGISYNPEGYSDQFNHIVLKFTASTKTVDMYINGELKRSEDSTLTSSTTSPIRLLRYGASYSADFELRMLNIHTEPQDPLELYNNAVKKGLLQ